VNIYGQRLLQPLYLLRYEPPLTGAKLVQEIKSQLKGEMRIRALETVMALMTIDGNNANSQVYFDNFVLNTWNGELSPPEAYQRCKAVCERVVDDYPGQQYKNPTTLELATQFLGAGGDTDRAVRGLQLLLVPDAVVGDSGQRVLFTAGGGMMIASSSSVTSAPRPRVTDRMLQRWLAVESGSWPGGASWLDAIATNAETWASNHKLQITDAVKLLSLAALRQHEAGLTEASAATLSILKLLDIPAPGDAIWLSDAARRCNRPVLAVEVESQLLEKRQLPLPRLAGLMKEVAEVKGVQAALALAEETLDFTWHSEFLGRMSLIASKAGLEERAAEWNSRRSQLLRLDPTPSKFGFVLGDGEEARLYRYQELESETVINDQLGETPVVLYFNREKREVRAFERGDREFFIEKGLVVDSSGNAVDQATGRGNGYALKALPYSLVETTSWRATYPNREVYIISALDRAKTVFFEKGAEGWKFYDEFPPAEDWNMPDFDDKDWKSGKAPLGYGEPYIATTLSFGSDPDNKNPSVYFRREVNIDDPKKLAKLVGRLRADDGAVVYLNGVEVHRQNMPDGTILPATNASSSATEGQFQLFLVDASRVVTGRNVLAIRIHQHDADSSDLVLDMELGALTKDDLK
jgi:hypothetical protein